jgi:hypothetical protein
LQVNYQPLCTWVINGKYKKLSTLKIKNIDFFPIQIYYLEKVLHANTMGQKCWCQRKSLLIWNFKTFYLSNDNSDLRSVFTNKSITTRSSKLAPILICFEKLFFLDLKLSTHLHVNYQPLCTWVINGKCKKLSTLKFKKLEIFVLSKFTI